MDRRDFLGKAGCGLACFAAAPLALEADQEQEAKKQRETPRPVIRGPRYKLDIEIYEARADSWCHKKGDQFEFPKDAGKICPWLLSSMQDFLLLLGHGVTLPWKYEGTPYEKVIDPDGITTEYVRCPDPTSQLVAKITRTKLG